MTAPGGRAVLGRRGALVACAGLFALVSATAAGAATDGASGAATRGAATQEPQPVSLRGAGTDGLSLMFEEWSSAFFEAPRSVDINYPNLGDGFLARGEFIDGDVDFAITGVPFTDEEEAALAAEHRPYVSAPISLAGLGLLLRAPVQGLATIEATDDGDVIVTPYDGPIRMPISAVNRVVYSTSNVWQDPEFRATFGGLNMRTFVQNATFVARSDAGATNFYLQQYLRIADPVAWAAAGERFGFETDTVTEFWGPAGLSTPTRPQASGVYNAVGQSANPSNGGTAQGGNVGALTAEFLLEAMAKFPGTDQRVIQLQNAAGEWVAPTPESIEAAFPDGDGTPMQGLQDEALTDAYPITWVNQLVAPTSGLSVDEANALATFMRFAATDGQAQAHVHGEGELPEALVEQALDAADAVVAGNCVGQGSVVAVGDPGPYAPSGATFPGATTWKRCVATPVVTTTTTSDVPTTTTTTTDPAPTTTTTSATSTTATSDETTATTTRPYVPPARPSVVRSGVDEGPSTFDTTPVTDTTAPPPDAAAPVDEIALPATTAAVVPAEIVDLPYALAVSTEEQRADRLTTMLLGAGTCALVLRIIRRRSAAHRDLG
jgi:ABC-type phosphate transport system substrate-binding protein